MKKLLLPLVLICFILSPTETKAALPVKLLQEECPELQKIKNPSSVQELQAKLQVVVPSMMAQDPNSKSWRVLSTTKLNRSSPYYKSAVKACNKETADQSYLIDVLVTKKSTNFPLHIHLLATNSVKKGWLIWGLTSY
ncbi:hypothetical protein [Guptibacillus algicola]|uniref:hypothetical protein n=1 Tax=Guptibacillus algicola TaxID=225844 RepID=UPI001CD44363|nr:hypothetical protein [Alkalihalobacillus algicola]MCA0988745.1 hypothetical protein [Alkalihalobacillus algicola]